MKLLLALLLATAPLSSVVAQAPPPAPATSPRIITNEDLRKYLLATTWSWQRPNGPKEKLQFFADGTARHSAFVAKYEIKGSREVELRIGKDRAKLTFDETYSRFDGIDFNGSRPIEGKRQLER